MKVAAANPKLWSSCKSKQPSSSVPSKMPTSLNSCMGISFGGTHNHNYALHYIGVASRYFPLSQLINHQDCIAVKIVSHHHRRCSWDFFSAGGAKYPRIFGRGCQISYSHGGSSFPEGVLVFLGKLHGGARFPGLPIFLWHQNVGVQYHYYISLWIWCIHFRLCQNNTSWRFMITTYWYHAALRLESLQHFDWMLQS